MNILNTSLLSSLFPNKDLYKLLASTFTPFPTIAKDYVVHDFVMPAVLKKNNKKEVGKIPKNHAQHMRLLA